MRVTRSVFALLASALVVIFAAAACGGGDDPPTSPTPPAANVPYSQVDLRVGTGAEATTGRRVTVNYTGWLYDAAAAENKGRQFDTSLQAGRTPLSLTVGSGRDVIAGFDMGVKDMRVGGLRRVVIPPNLGYGASGSGPIPPNATLIFEIELLTVS
jgi:FKBP-type peptidyl-prolyl cis-trans isomerase FkpA